MFRVLRRRLAKTAQPRAPLVCSRCGADALCPIEWVTFGDHAWLMWMRYSPGDKRANVAIPCLFDSALIVAFPTTVIGTPN